MMESIFIYAMAALGVAMTLYTIFFIVTAIVYGKEYIEDIKERRNFKKEENFEKLCKERFGEDSYRIKFLIKQDMNEKFKFQKMMDEDDVSFPNKEGF